MSGHVVFRLAVRRSEDLSLVLLAHLKVLQAEKGHLGTVSKLLKFHAGHGASILSNVLIKGFGSNA